MTVGVRGFKASKNISIGGDHEQLLPAFIKFERAAKWLRLGRQSRESKYQFQWINQAVPIRMSVPPFSSMQRSFGRTA
jgi:hypothetical protein